MAGLDDFERTEAMENDTERASRAKDLHDQGAVDSPNLEALLCPAVRHLGTAEHQAQGLDRAPEYLQASTRLRQEQGFSAGVATNLVGLAYIAAAQEHPDDANELLRQAASLAEADQALGILRQIEEAQNHLNRSR